MTSARLAASLLAILLVAIVEPTSAAPAKTVPVYFVRGEQLAPVARPGTTAEDAVRRLIAGPTPAETRRGFRTYVPAGTRLRAVSVSDGLATVDLSERFAAGGEAASLLARLSQLVRTLTGLQGTQRVQLLLNGETVAARFPGVPTEGPITFRFLQTPNVPVPTSAEPRLLPPEEGVRNVQRRLI